MGHQGEKGRGPGDLYLRVMLKPHPVFKKVGKDLHMEKFISFPLAVLGGTTKIKALSGEELEVFVQPGTECGSTKTIPGMGFLEGGNLVITYRSAKECGRKTKEVNSRIGKGRMSTLSVYWLG